MPLHAVTGSQLNRIAPTLESYLEDQVLNMPKDARPSFSRPYRTEPYPTMQAVSPPTRRESITSAAPSHERPSTAWTSEDDARLMDLRKQGLNWGPVAANFVGKTANACRKRHERLMERKHTTEFDGMRIEELSSAYFECREQMWKIMAEYLNEPKWQTLENKCFSNGLKTLQTAARQRTRGRNVSPAGSHSDGFDDSGLGHSPPDTILPLPHTSQSPSSLRTSREGSSYPVSRTIDPPRPPILSGVPTHYTYPSHSTHPAFPSAYATLPPPTQAPGHQTLPSLNRTFGANELPPVTVGYGPRHVGPSYC